MLCSALLPPLFSNSVGSCMYPLTQPGYGVNGLDMSPKPGLIDNIHTSISMLDNFLECNKRVFHLHNLLSNVARRPQMIP